jgi:uncharacterized protein YjiS (DUF1127 family)
MEHSTTPVLWIDPLLPWERLRRRVVALGWRTAVQLGAWLAQQSAARQRVRTQRALRQLSPRLLRDIGVPEEIGFAAAAWYEAQEARRERFLGGY